MVEIASHKGYGCYMHQINVKSTFMSERAYNYVSWKCLEYMMKRMNFDVIWII
jgi:hypothetical protein